MGFASVIGQVFLVIIFMLMFANMFVIQHRQNALQTELFEYQQAKLSAASGHGLELFDAHYNTTFNTTNLAILNVGSESYDINTMDLYIGDYKFDRNYTNRKLEACVYMRNERCGEIRFGDSPVQNEEANLQLLYHFNNDTNFGPGTVLENYATTGNANDMTITRLWLNTTAKFGRSFYFNGVDAFATRANTGQNSFTNTTSYTWSFWINPTGVSGSANTIVSKNAAATGYSIYLNSAGTLQMRSANGNYVFNATRNIPFNEWTHVTVVYTTTQIRFYLNGTSINNVTNPAIFRGDTGTYTIGRNDSTSTDYYFGLLDEFAQYNVARTDAQIRTLYRKGVFGGNIYMFEPGEILEIDAYRSLPTGQYTITLATQEGATISSQISS